MLVELRVLTIVHSPSPAPSLFDIYIVFYCSMCRQGSATSGLIDSAVCYEIYKQLIAHLIAC